MNDMSQWSNRYQILDTLENCNDYLDSSSASESESETISESILPSLPSKILIRSANSTKLSTKVPILLSTFDNHSSLSPIALLDCGATGMFIDTKFAQRHNLNTTKLQRSIPVYNVDGTLNQGGSIQEEIVLSMKVMNHTEKAIFYVCDLGDKDVILGHTWLHHHNPEINWKTGEIGFTRCPKDCNMQAVRERRKRHKTNAKIRKKLPVLPEDTENEESEETVEEGERVFVTFFRTNAVRNFWINAASTVSQKLAEQSKSKEPKSFEESVPSSYHNYKDVFDKESFDQLPDKKQWDHAIELKPGSEPFRSKIYPLSGNEQVELDAFIEENLKSGRIRPSKSPMASPVFFIKKKDGSLRLVQDYRKLNSMTVKNSYPLPLIHDIVNKLKKAKYFTKLDVRWGYNNVRIKEGDEWKAAFRTPKGLLNHLLYSLVLPTVLLLFKL